MVVHLKHMLVKFEYQGHWVKVKVIFLKLTILTVGHQISSEGQGNFWVKVNPESNCKCLDFYPRRLAFIQMLM